MKKAYSKPQIHVESFLMDRPIALTCDVDRALMVELVFSGYFMEGKNCSMKLLPNGGFDFTGDGIADSHDTVCYHSNVQQAYLS